MAVLAFKVADWLLIKNRKVPYFMFCTDFGNKIKTETVHFDLIAAKKKIFKVKSQFSMWIFLVFDSFGIFHLILAYEGHFAQNQDIYIYVCMFPALSFNLICDTWSSTNNFALLAQVVTFLLSKWPISVLLHGHLCQVYIKLPSGR